MLVNTWGHLNIKIEIWYPIIDAQDKEEAVKLFKSLGLDMTTAITLFLKQSVAEQALPFRPALNPDTRQAMAETEQGVGETFDSFEAWEDRINHDLKTKND